MKCHEMNKLLLEHSFGELSIGQQAKLAEHLAVCQACQGEQETLGKLEAALTAQKIADPGEAFWQNLSSQTLARIKTKKESPAEWLYRLISLPRLAYAVGMVGCLMLVMYIFGHRRQPVEIPDNNLVTYQNNIVADAGLWDELLPQDELVNSIWGLDEVEMDTLSMKLAQELNTNDIVRSAVFSPLAVELEADIYQTIDQLDTTELEYVYQSLKPGQASSIQAAPDSLSEKRLKQTSIKV